MSERRRMRRFNLQLPCLIGIVDSDRPEEIFHLKTRNVSTAGAYLDIHRPPPVGTSMKIEMLVMRAVKTADGLTGSCISLYGAVVRTAPHGMAVRFESSYRINRIVQLVAFARARNRWLEAWCHNAQVTAGMPDRCSHGGHPEKRDGPLELAMIDESQPLTVC